MRVRAIVTGIIAIIVVGLAGRALPTAAAGQRIYVDASVSSSGSGHGNWSNAFKTLQEGLTAAGSGDEIWVADGTYVPGTFRTDTFTLKSNVTLLGGFAGGENQASDRDPLAHPAILSGEIGTVATNDNTYRIVSDGGTTGAVLDGFTVEAAYNNSAPATNSGGGLFATGSPTIRNVIFTGNHVAGQGAGAYSVTGSLTLENVSFTSNSSDSTGGGLYAGGTTIATNITFQGNSAAGSGGGIEVTGTSTTLKNATVTGNSAGASSGQGLDVDTGTLVIQNSVFYANAGSSDQIRRDGGTVTITNSIVASGCPAGATCAGLVAGDPMLGLLQDNGGLVTTMAIPTSSAALDSGDNATCAATDARGVTRPQDGDGNATATCDLGAYELTTSKVQFQSASSSGGENQSPTIEVVLDVQSQSTVTVNYAATGGTATGGGTDYTLASGTLTFLTGDVSESITLNVVDDSLDEANETVIITLSSPSGAVLGTQNPYTYTINDNDPGPTIQFATGSANGLESVTNVQVPVSLSTASGQPITVDFAVTGGTATSPADFTLPASPLTIPAGATTKKLLLKVNNDFFVESDETLVITLSNPSSGSLGAITSFTYAIKNNDSGTCRGKAATIVGTAAANTIVGTAGNDVIVAGDGNDTVKAGGGSDLVCGGKGNDKLFGQAGNDKLFGEAGDDLLSGGGGADALAGGGGKDTGKGGGANDKVNGGGANDTLDGGGGTDAVNGGAGDDTVKGGGGNNDVVKGQGGKDKLAGGLGTGDKCDGGLGVDALLVGHGCETTAGIP